MAFIFNLMLDVINKSKQLLLLAQASKWEEFSALDTERQAILSKFDLESIEMSEQDNEQLYNQMSELIVLNSELELLCIAQREHAADELHNLRKSSKVAQAYSQ